MMILGLDTSSEYAVLTLGNENGQSYRHSSKKHERELSSKLYGMLDALLAQAGIEFDQVDAFAVGLGPGSFTGVRVAVTTMRTLAQVTGKPLVGVPTLDIYAVEAWSRSMQDPVAKQYSVMVLLPSRRNEVYLGLYNASGRIAQEAATYRDAIERVKQLPYASTVTASSELLRSLFPDGIFESHQAQAQEHPSPTAFSELAAAAFRAGEFRDPLSLDPMYVVPPAVSQHKKSISGP